MKANYVGIIFNRDSKPFRTLKPYLPGENWNWKIANGTKKKYSKPKYDINSSNIFQMFLKWRWHSNYYRDLQAIISHNQSESVIIMEPILAQNQEAPVVGRGPGLDWVQKLPSTTVIDFWLSCNYCNTMQQIALVSLTQWWCLLLPHVSVCTCVC